jgi:predicted GH43/DUF377 family glycosyl hydrolase
MKKRIVVNKTRFRGVPKGITPEAFESILDRNKLTALEKNKIKAEHSPVVSILNKNKRKKMARRKKNKEVPGKRTTFAKRPPNEYLTSLANKVTRMPFPEKGNFNAGLVAMPGGGYVCVYRPHEHAFVACFLKSDLSVVPDSYFPFSITNCADPRLIWTSQKKLLMVYSSTEEVGIRNECIRGAFIMDLNESRSFIDPIPFRVSPFDLKQRQKNWMPFLYEGEVHLISSVCPHAVWHLKLDAKLPVCEKLYETKWDHPWMFDEFLRGNTNIVKLDDGNYLGTFHTASWYDRRCFYDNGAYVFEGKPPFRVLRCANRSYLKAEDAIEPHFRKHDLIVCTFPCGMVREGNKLLISYGDNDSVTKIMETTTEDMLALTLPVY